MNLNREETARLNGALIRYLGVTPDKLDYEILHKASSDNVVVVRAYSPALEKRVALYVTVRGVTTIDPRPQRKKKTRD